MNDTNHETGLQGGLLKRYPSIAWLLAILSFFTLLNGGIAAMDNVRWWAWRSEVKQIAGVAYPARLVQKREFLLLVERQIREVEASRDPANRAVLPDLYRRKAELEAVIQQLEREHRRFET